MLSKEETDVFQKYIIGKPAKFYLVPGFLVTYDRLYLDKASWTSLRDCGIFPEEYQIKVRLEKMIAIEALLKLAITWLLLKIKISFATLSRSKHPSVPAVTLM